MAVRERHYLKKTGTYITLKHHRNDARKKAEQVCDSIDSLDSSMTFSTFP